MVVWKFWSDYLIVFTESKTHLVTHLENGARDSPKGLFLAGCANKPVKYAEEAGGPQKTLTTFVEPQMLASAGKCLIKESQRQRNQLNLSLCC